MPIRKMMALFLVCTVLGVAIPLIVIKGFGVGGSEQSEQAAAAPEPVASEPIASSTPSSFAAATPKEKDPANPAYPVEGVYCTGFIARGERIVVCLSDGSQLTEASPSLGRVYAGSHVVINGRIVPIRGRTREAVQEQGNGGLPLGLASGPSPSPVPQRRVIEPPIIIGSDVDPRLPKSSGRPDPAMRRMIEVASAGRESIEQEARRRFSDPIHR